jgi:hypothetical protein
MGPATVRYNSVFRSSDKPDRSARRPFATLIVWSRAAVEAGDQTEKLASMNGRPPTELDMVARCSAADALRWPLGRPRENRLTGRAA